MDQPDQIFARLPQTSDVILPVIACLFTGPIPPFACAMLREPEAPLGAKLDFRFVDALRDAVRLNSAVHDGAVMLGRSDSLADYIVTGWSFRLFPPLFEEPFPNRGSAFNSCLAMSGIEGVDRLYLASRDGSFRFMAGKVVTLTL